MDQMDQNVNQETQRVPQPPRRRRSLRQKNGGCAGTVVYVIAVLGISVILSLAAIFVANDVFAFVKENAVKEITVSENTDLLSLAKQLDDEGVINYGTIFKLYVLSLIHILAAHMDDIHATLFCGLGGSLDVFAGVAKRAPKIFIKLGLEWFYRLLCQPSRIGRMMKLPKFLLIVIRERMFGKQK